MEKVPFIFEIGSEEIPAGYIGPALEAIKEQTLRFLENSRITFGNAHTAGTPRRLVLVVSDVAVTQEPAIQEIIGPPYNVAFTEDGRPTRAAEGFARSQNVSIDDLKIKETPKGKYVYVMREEKGTATKDLLEKFLPNLIAHIPFPKSMRWGSQTVTFARPIHWIVAILGDATLNFKYGDIQSGRESRGHRFMKPDVITVPSNYEEYKQILRNHFVILDTEERKELIRKALEEKSKEVGGRVLEDEELLEEVTNLVEYPHALIGKFEDHYLKLPPEVPITVMKEHQRYFAVVDDNGNLMPYFITIANTVPKQSEVVIKGNERVIKARLEDARFYFEEDRKIPLEKRAEELKDVVFHSKLGTSWEKVERFTAIAKWIAEQLELTEQQRKKLERAALLCKADLVSGMVGEFPELQGVMGRAYALEQGEDPEVAQAIYEHYLPDRATGPVPKGIVGAVLSIADKIDTIVGCFGVGLIPTGTADPFALRRQTLGIIRILLEKEFHISLKQLIDIALPGLKKWITEPENLVRSGVLNFFEGRFHHYMVNNYGYSTDVVGAVLSAGMDDLVEDVRKIEALAAFKNRPDFNSLAVAFKRVVNIIKEPETSPVDPTLLQEEAERELWDRVQVIRERFSSALSEGKYEKGLEELATLKPAIDRFFDSVLVMAQDESLKRNRLAILTSIKNLFDRVADFRKIHSEG